MAKYSKENIRNIALIGQGGTGKTTLGEIILFTTKVTDRLGRVDDGTSNLDYEPEETKRKITISTSIHHCEWNKGRINIIDTPGYANFIADTRRCLQAADSCIFILDATSEIKVESEKVWRYAEELNLPILIVINKMDRERADSMRTLEGFRKIISPDAILLQLPVGKEESFSSVIDLIKMKVLKYDMDSSGKFSEEEVSVELKTIAQKYRDTLIENIAETNDELIEKYLGGESLTNEEIRKALMDSILNRKCYPVFHTSAMKNIGIHPLINAIIEYIPTPVFRGVIKGIDPKSKKEVEIRPDERERFSAIVFKTISDSYSGKLTVFRIMSGSLTSDSTVYNSSREVKERFGQIFEIEGKKQKAISQATVGDIVAVAKLKETLTGDTLCDENGRVLYPSLSQLPTIISFSLHPKAKGDEEKIFASLSKLMEEDPSIRVSRNEETKEIILSGMGQVHIEVTVEKLRRKFGVDVYLKLPKIPYKETIKGKARVQGKYKRQSGGRGQYGDTWLEIEPLPRGSKFEFVDKIVGGVIPRQYIPAVEKGIKEAMQEGVLAGYPVVDIRVTLFDGSYHTVDSSELAFKIAASMGFKKGVQESNPVLLEPIMSLEISIPDENLGDVIGDINSRRGRVLGVEPRVNTQVIKAHVPMAEVLKYANDLTSITGGRGDFSMAFSHYEEVPSHIAEKIISESKKE